MAETVPAMRGRLGTTEYFIVTMKAKRVAEKMKTATEIDGWEELSLDEKYQREINLNRVKKEIAPYFADNKDRFTGSLIVAMQNSENNEYEPVKEVIKANSFSGSHKSAADNLGFLTFSDEEVFIPIDGQHRAKALQYAISGRDEKNDTLPFHPDASLAQEDVVVMLVKFNSTEEKQKARRIFNKVNRYAKQPSKAETLIIDDDDVVAVLTRRMTRKDDGFLTGDLVEISGNTLPAKSGAFTTLATLYEINKEILQKRGHSDISQSQRPTPEEENIYWRELLGTWEFLIENFDEFNAALLNQSDEGDETRRQMRQTCLALKPIGQRVLLRAFLDNTESRQDGQNPDFDRDTAISRLNAVDWTLSNPIWLNILTRDESRVMSGLAAISIGADFVSYLIGAPSIDPAELKERIAPNSPDYKLPEPLF